MKKFIILIAILALAAPAMAGDLSVYGNSRFGTFSVTDDPETGGEDDTDTEWGPYWLSSRFGLKVASGDITALWEMRPTSASDTRQFWAAWNFGAGELLVGQTWSPISTFAANQVYGNDTGLGSIGDNSYRTPMIQLKFGALKVAFVAPGTGGGIIDVAASNTAGEVETVSTAAADFSVDTVLPKLEVSYAFSTDMFGVMPYAGYQNYEATILGDEEDITSTIYGLKVNVNFGPAYFIGNVYMANNFNNYGGWDEVVAAHAAYDGDSIEDAESFGYTLCLGAKFSDMIGVEAGYGKIKTEIQSSEDEAFAYYVQLPITLAPGVMLIPEYGKFDYEQDFFGSEEGTTTYFGAKWQINF